MSLWVFITLRYKLLHSAFVFHIENDAFASLDCVLQNQSGLFGFYQLLFFFLDLSDFFVCYLFLEMFNLTTKLKLFFSFLFFWDVDHRG